MDYELQFSDKEITPWGGMALMKRMLERMDMESILGRLALPQPGSNRGYKPEQLLQQFMLSIWCGANRFEHTEVTRHDGVLQRLFGWTRMANFKAITRLFGKFNQATNDVVFGAWYAWLFQSLRIGGLTLDLDSTVMTRYGKQEGAAVGYNPNKRGRLSHHPLLAFVADVQMVANCWLRPGNTHSANNVDAFLQATLQNLGDKQVELVRADSGFSGNSFLETLEKKPFHYIVALPLRQPLQRALVSHSGWWPIHEPGAEGIEIAHFDYQCSTWQRPRRVVAIRQHIGQREQTTGKTLSLFGNDPIYQQYRYSVLTTNLKLPALIIWRTYRGRADCENRIKELKYDFAADSFCLNDFFATEACLNTVMMAYNLMSLFRQTLLKTKPRHTLKTLRYKLFNTASYITHEGRKNILKMALDMKRRAWMTGLWEQSSNLDLPAQFSAIFSADQGP